MNFSDVRDGLGSYLCGRMGMDISGCQDWPDLASTFRDFSFDNDLVGRARELYGLGSTGERAVLQALLYAADYAALADELGKQRTFQQLAYTAGTHRETVMACLERRRDSDSGEGEGCFDPLLRLMKHARSGTGQGRRVGSFLLAWWNAHNCGGFDLTDFWSLDAALRRDVLRVMEFVAWADGRYPDAFGYGPVFEDLVARLRPHLVPSDE